ncbi:MAG: DUF4956 domain-containing protein [Bacteroidales bacterium]
MAPFFYDFDSDPLWNIIVRFAFNLFVIFILIRVIYIGFSKKHELLFPFFLMGSMIFLICALLKTVEVTIGLAFSLFAVFAIIRFRSENLPIKAMAYFFTIIGISAINAMSVFPYIVRGPLIVNSVVVILILILEIYSTKKELIKHQLVYNKLELLSPDKIDELLTDISSRTGKKIERVTIKKIDLVKGIAELEVFYRNSKTIKLSA